MANSYSAEFGRSASGAINIVTKSGGNAIRGSGFYFRRDDAFDKPNYFAVTVPAVQDRAVRRHGRRAGRAEPAVLLRFLGAARQQPQRCRSTSRSRSATTSPRSATTHAPTCRSQTDEHNLFGKGTFLWSAEPHADTAPTCTTTAT